jgi:predicted porin
VVLTCAISLLAIAIAAALPAVASAQVTISGYAKGSFDSFSIGSPLSAAAAASGNGATDAVRGTPSNTGRLGKTSESRVTDHSSRIIFSAVEQINDDLSGVFQYDLRFSVDQTARAGNEGGAASGPYVGGATNQKLDGWMANPAAVTNPLSSGNNHVGIVSKSMGALRFGRQDIYYDVTGSVMPSSVHINASAPTIMHSPAPGVAMANFSRTPNLIWYTSPVIQGFNVVAGYSTNPLRVSGTNETENDLSTTSATRRGDGTFLRLNGTVGPFALSFATVNLKSDYFGGTCTNSNGNCVFETVANANTNANQKGNALSAIYRSGPIAVGAAYSMNKAAFGPGGNTSTNANLANANFERSAFNLSAAYTMGKNTIAVERQTANDWTRNGVKAADTGATGTTLAWDYAFSKRTNIGLTYFVLDNDAYSQLAPFYSGSNTFGGHFAAKNGETYKLTSFVMRHTW